MSQVVFYTLPGTKRASHAIGDETRTLTGDATDINGVTVPAGTKVRDCKPSIGCVTGALRWAFTVVAALALVAGVSSPASAETCDGRGKCVKITADKVIAERQLVCTYGKTRFESDPKGRTVVIMGKVCTEVSR